jgi:hypothetical protein
MKQLSPEVAEGAGMAADGKQPGETSGLGGGADASFRDADVLGQICRGCVLV